MKLRLDTTKAEASKPRLSDKTAVLDQETGELRYYGKLQNLKVRVSAAGILVKGSLAKFHLGNNIETLTREEAVRAIEHLSDELNQPMAEARVFRLDVAKTFVMERPPADYWRFFLAPTRMMRIEVPDETLTFANGQRSILFYDKLAELRQRRRGLDNRAENGLPSRFQEHPNLLRYEVQFKQRLDRVFGEHEIRAASLTKADFYEKVVKQWQKEYFKLLRSSSVPRIVGGTTVKSRMKFLAGVGLSAYGPQHYIDDIEIDLLAGHIDKYQAVRIRKNGRDLLRAEGIKVAGNVLEELDAKVSQVVALCE